MRRRLQTAHAGLATVKAMEKTSQVMANVNQRMDVPKLQQTMQSFERESAKLDMTDELSACTCWRHRERRSRSSSSPLWPCSCSVRAARPVNDTIDSIMDGSDDEEETNNIIDQVLEEVGLDVKSGVRVASSRLTRVTTGHVTYAIAQSSCPFLPPHRWPRFRAPAPRERRRHRPRPPRTTS